MRLRGRAGSHASEIHVFFSETPQRRRDAPVLMQFL